LRQEKELIERYGKLYSEELGINLKKGEKEWFKWLIASVLFGARISETIAKNTYRALVKHNLLTPQRILQAGRAYLIRHIMSEGGYVRYDGITSNYLQSICKKLIKEYDGKIANVHKKAKDPKDLENRLLDFKGIGPVTVNIFLREMKCVWKKAKPELLPFIKELARKYNISLNKIKRKSEKSMRLEAALVRLRKIPKQKTELSD